VIEQLGPEGIGGVAGVLFETWRSKINLVKAMMTGVKEIPDPSA